VPEQWNPPNFDDISTDELVTAAYLNQLGNSLRFLREVNYSEFTADVNVTATTVGSANQIITSGAITYENVPHLIEFFCPNVTSVGADLYVILRDSTTVLGTINILLAGSGGHGIYAARRLTPSAASHTFNVAGWLGSADTVVIEAGSGGTAGNDTTPFPGFIRIRRVPT
jgi:hypothetical protein